jgi:hypothetical protein
MPFVPFYALCPEDAVRETRSVHAQSGIYSFVEPFCDEPGCDCRRAYFEVFKNDKGGRLATLTWGWEPPAFYRNWASFPLSKEDLRELTGPALARMAVQSPIAPELLDMLCEMLKDDEYRNRVIRHYRQFRGQVDARGAQCCNPVGITGWRGSSKRRRK